jgi:hypothetical protein
MIAVKTAMGFELKQDSSLWFGTDIFRLSFLCLLSMSLNAQNKPLGNNRIAPSVCMRVVRCQFTKIPQDPSPL